MNTKTLGYILKRIGLALLTVLIVITITFFTMHAAPGNPFMGEKALSPEAEAALIAKHGLDKPLIVQYLIYLKDIVFHFDFGESLSKDHFQVIDLIIDGMKTSVWLGLIAAALAAITGIIFGAVAALRRNKLIDRIIMVITTAFVSMPSFIMGTFMLLLALQWSLQLTDWGSLSIVQETPILKEIIEFVRIPLNAGGEGWDRVKGLILPIIALSLSPMANITRLTRSSMLDVLGQDYIRTAKAKGVSSIKIIFGHALKNALIPVITYFGPMLAYIVTGSLVIEKIFAVNGIGGAFVNSITARDYPLIMGTTIILAVLIVVMNLVSDIMYKVVDPRITLE